MSITFPYNIHLGFEYYLGEKYKLIAYVKGDITIEDISNIQDIIEDKLKDYEDYDCFDYYKCTAYTPDYPYHHTVNLFDLTTLPFDNDIEHFLRRLSDVLAECNIDVRG
jgi:hypothetical protein